MVESDSEFGESRRNRRFFGTHFMEDGGFELGDALQSPEVAYDTVGEFMVEERRWV